MKRAIIIDAPAGTLTLEGYTERDLVVQVLRFATVIQLLGPKASIRRVGR